MQNLVSQGLIAFVIKSGWPQRFLLPEQIDEVDITPYLG